MRREVTAIDVREFTDDVALRGVLAHEELRKLYGSRGVSWSLVHRTFTETYAEAGVEDTGAFLNSTADLGAALPHNLGEVGGLRVVGVVFG